MFVSVGTDHQPFDRLSRWVDLAVTRHPALVVWMQAGTSVLPQRAAAQPYLTYDEMRQGMAGADVVVCHGGPATIIEARAVGHRPIVVPRRHDLGEHVDDHQVRFARWMAARGQVVLADDVDQFVDVLTAVSRGAVSLRRAGGDDSEPAGVRRFAELMDSLLGQTAGGARTGARVVSSIGEKPGGTVPVEHHDRPHALDAGSRRPSPDAAVTEP